MSENEREAAQLERPRCVVEPATPHLFIADVVGELDPVRGYGTRAMRPVDPARDAELLRAWGWVAVSEIEALAARLAAAGLLDVAEGLASLVEGKAC